MYVAESASAYIEIWERLDTRRRVKMSVHCRLGNVYGDDVDSVSRVGDSSDHEAIYF